MEITELDQKRFWSKVALPDGNGCMLWMASTWDGYGRFKLADTMRQAHRLSYVLAFGEIPAGLLLDHLCRVRHCVAPLHLEAVTSAENTHRGKTIAAANAAKTQCPQGHPYDGENLHVSPSGGRRCMACQRRRDRARWGIEEAVGDAIELPYALRHGAWNSEENWT